MRYILNVGTPNSVLVCMYLCSMKPLNLIWDINNHRTLACRTQVATNELCRYQKSKRVTFCSQSKSKNMLFSQLKIFRGFTYLRRLLTFQFVSYYGMHISNTSLKLPLLFWLNNSLNPQLINMKKREKLPESKQE